MQKIVFSLLSVLFVQAVSAQSNSNSIGLYISNNGQANFTCARFYHLGDPTAYLDDSNTGKELNIMPVVQYVYRKKDFAAGLRVGNSIMRHSYEKKNAMEYSLVEDRQNVFVLVPSAFYVQDVGLLSFSLGAEIPFHFVGDFTEDSHYVYKPDSLNIQAEYIGTATMDGGFLMGINAVVGARLNLGEHFFLSAQSSLGLQYAHLGGLFSTTYSYVFPAQSLDTTFDKTYRAISFPTPEVLFGIGFHF